jgi:hypothetical protein
VSHEIACLTVASNNSMLLLPHRLLKCENSSLIDPDEGRFGDNMPACFSLDLAAGGLGAERQVVDRKREQTKVIAMRSMTAGRAGTAVTRPMKVINGLLESYRAAVMAGAFGKSRLVSLNIVSGPMVPFTCGRIRVVTEKHETSSRRRYGPPV